MTVMTEHDRDPTNDGMHAHKHVQLDEAEWAQWAADTEREGEVLISFVTDTVAWIDKFRGPGARTPRRILDIGAGPGVGTCELARLFPEAEVVAVDASPAMLGRASERAAARGLGSRVSTHLAELPGGLGQLGTADLIWASMSLHHVGDEVAALRSLRAVLAPGGTLAIAELADPMRVLPTDLGIGRPQLESRLDAASDEWYARMRSGLPDTVASGDLATMLTSAGLDVVGDEVLRAHLPAPLAAEARDFVVGHLRRTRHHLEALLDAQDLATLDALLDDENPLGFANRADTFIDASRRVVLAEVTAER